MSDGTSPLDLDAVGLSSSIEEPPLIVCFIAPCGNHYEYLLEGVAPLLIVIVAALLARQWHELFLVALGGVAAALTVTILGDVLYRRSGVGLPNLIEFLLVYVMFLLVTAIAHLGKRVVMALLARRSLAP